MGLPPLRTAEARRCGTRIPTAVASASVAERPPARLVAALSFGTRPRLAGRPADFDVQATEDRPLQLREPPLEPHRPPARRVAALRRQHPRRHRRRHRHRDPLGRRPHRRGPRPGGGGGAARRPGGVGGEPRLRLGQRDRCRPRQPHPAPRAGHRSGLRRRHPVDALRRAGGHRVRGQREGLRGAVVVEPGRRRRRRVAGGHHVPADHRPGPAGPRGGSRPALTWCRSSRTTRRSSRGAGPRTSTASCARSTPART